MTRILPLVISVLIAGIGYGLTFPLLAIRLEQTGASGALIGMNAAMPALGWILGSALLPVLQVRARISVRILAVVFLLSAGLGIVGLRYAEGYASMTALRFLFGGSMGMFLRCVEYWLNRDAADHQRGQLLAIYGAALMSSIVVGSALQPLVGTAGWTAFGPPLALSLVAAVVLATWPGLVVPPIASSSERIEGGVMLAIPAAFLAVLVYGFAEAIPTSLIQIYALRNGLGETVAAYALSASALGGILLQIPVLAVSDRFGRLVPLISCAVLGAVASALVPLTVAEPVRFLVLLGALGGALACVYSLGLAMIGDRFNGDRLVVANAAFGMVYAAASLAGPLVNGAALDLMSTHGVMVSAAAAFAVLAGGSLALHLAGAMRRVS